jgi:acetyl-CoA acetyltransferase
MRGKLAIVGYGETPHVRNWPGRTDYGLCAEAGAMAIQDAGLEPTDIDCLVTLGAGQQPPGPMVHHMGLNNVKLALGSTMAGSSAGAAFAATANLLAPGLVKYVLGTFGGARDVGILGEEQRMGARTIAADSPGTEFGRGPYGVTVAANDGYGHMYTRHMHEFGTTREQLARIAVNQRFNTLNVPRSFFASHGPITVDDVLSARYTNYPITLLQSVMPVAGAIAWIATSGERASSHPHTPVYMLGLGVKEYSSNSDIQQTRWVEPGVKYTSRLAYEMSGYGPNDMDFANFYD